MAVAAMFQIQVNAMKWAITARFQGNLIHRRRKTCSVQKITEAEVSTNFQDGRRRHFGSSSECYKMGNYHPISMKIGTRSQRSMVSLKFPIPEA
jgi:hypothetical protein